MWLFGSRERAKQLAQDRALRAFYLTRCAELDSLDEVSEADFEQWRYQLFDYEVDEFVEAGEYLLAEPEQHVEGDVFDWLGGDAKTAWQHYQQAQRGYGVVQWCMRCVSWIHGLPWF